MTSCKYQQGGDGECVNFVQNKYGKGLFKVKEFLNQCSFAALWTKKEDLVRDYQDKNLINWRLISNKKTSKKNIGLPRCLRLRNDWDQNLKKEQNIPFIPLEMVWIYHCKVFDVENKSHFLQFAINLIELVTQANTVACLQKKIGKQFAVPFVNPITQRFFDAGDIALMKVQYTSAYKQVHQQFDIIKTLNNANLTTGVCNAAIQALKFIGLSNAFPSLLSALPSLKLLGWIIPLISFAAMTFNNNDGDALVALTFEQKFNYLNSAMKSTNKSNLWITLGGDVLGFLMRAGKLFNSIKFTPFSRNLAGKLNKMDTSRALMSCKNN